MTEFILGVVLAALLFAQIARRRARKETERQLYAARLSRVVTFEGEE